MRIGLPLGLFKSRKSVELAVLASLPNKKRSVSKMKLSVANLLGFGFLALTGVIILGYLGDKDENEEENGEEFEQPPKIPQKAVRTGRKTSISSASSSSARSPKQTTRAAAPVASSGDDQNLEALLGKANLFKASGFALVLINFLKAILTKQKIFIYNAFTCWNQILLWDLNTITQL
jgi:hypothetical protein